MSLAQAGLAVAATGNVETTPPATSRDLFHAINLADSGKLLLLGCFVTVVALAAHSAGALPRWLAVLSAVLAPLLPVSGAGYLTDNAGLLALLFVSLPLLLAWAASVVAVVLVRPGSR